MALLKIACVALVLLILLTPISISPLLKTTAKSSTSYPLIQDFSANVNRSESSTIFVPVDNTGSPLNWTGMHLYYVNGVNGIKITTDSLLFVDGFVQAFSANYSLKIGITIGNNVSMGTYTIPFTLTATSSSHTTTEIKFNLIILVLVSPPAQFPIIYMYLAFTLITIATMIGIILIWSKSWTKP
ncbi:MAG: hypothetical protein ACYCQJ_01075 [Nitrososphaerales archaeon]